MTSEPSPIDLAIALLAAHSDDEICERTGLTQEEVLGLRASQASNPAKATHPAPRQRSDRAQPH